MSVIMRNHQRFPEETDLLYQNLQSCHCCPYGYHIDLDFVRYCESLVNAKPSDGQLLRRDKRRSRKSLEVMLGLENFYQWEPADKVHPVHEVQLEIEPDSPRVVNKFHYKYDGSDSSKLSSPNSSPETSAFVHDVLDEVVSDFERTLERTKKKAKHNNNNNHNNRIWGQCFDEIDSCVSGNKTKSRKEDFSPPTLEKEEEIESIGSNGSDKSTTALHNIRDQMAISLTRMKDLEEQVKNIPLLQQQLITLREEKRQLQLQLRKDEQTTIAKITTTNVPASAKLVQLPFTPQRISPVALESMGSRIRSNSQTESTKKIMKRDIGIMCSQHTRDVGTLASPNMVRSVGTNPTSTNGIHDDLYTKRELDTLIKTSLEDYECKREIEKQRNLISIGTQMIPKIQPEKKDIYIQTIIEKEIPKLSQGIMVCPSQRDAYIMCKPETRTIGLSDHKITDILCDKCSINKRTVGCGPDHEETKNYLSLKLMDMPPRSLSFSLGETEKLNIKRKTIGTQCKISVQNVAIQKAVSMESIGIQNAVNVLTKSSQTIYENVTKQTDTIDLIKFIDCNTNTDDYKIKSSDRITCDNSSNTDISRQIDNGTNPLPPIKTKHTSSNTEMVHKKDVGCGEIIKPHISISCADNYCDSCKDAIKNLAREFSKVLGSPILSGENSRIPRPTTLTSPRPVRKKFMRQNTYTVATPSPSPELRTISEISIKTSSSSLDSVKPTGKIRNDNVDVDVCHDNNDNKSITHNLNKETISLCDVATNIVGADDGAIITSETLKSPSWQELNTEKPDTNLMNGDDVPKILDEKYIDNSSHHMKNMLLNQIATSSTAPRTKVTPSKEMRAAMKVINDSLQKTKSKSNNLKSANALVQKEWFRISSTDHAIPLDVEDYLDCFEEFSNLVLKYIVNMADNNGNTAMHYAVSHGNFDVVSILLDSKVCNVNQTNNAGYTCVMLVSLAKLKNSAHRTVVQRLFQMADVNIRAKKHCQTALMLAVSHGNLDMVEMLLHAGADINIQDEDGSSALMCAAEHGRIDIVKHLLSQPDCDSLIQDVDGSTAFKIAWQAGHRDIGLLLYVHEQMLRSKMPNRPEQRSPVVSRHQTQQNHQQQQQKSQ